MHTKWLLILSGLNLFAAITDIIGVACSTVNDEHEPQRTKRNTEEIEEIELVLGGQQRTIDQDRFRIKAIVFSYPLTNCTSNNECDIAHALCYGGRCVCEPGYMILNYQCLKKADIHKECHYDAQCSTGECSVPKDCKCNFGGGKLGFCVFNENPLETTSGMMKVLMVITGFVVVATITCITTVAYRRLRPRIPRGIPVLDLSRERIEDGINPASITLDGPPPQYEEVVKVPHQTSPVGSPTKDYSEPPSYGEYLEHQRNSLQPMIETHRAPRWSPLASRSGRNESLFLGRF